eukprot:351780-Chlamydomonas_euryale.AAC.1
MQMPAGGGRGDVGADDTRQQQPPGQQQQHREPNPLRSLGDALERWRQDLSVKHEAPEQPQAGGGGEGVGGVLEACRNSGGGEDGTPPCAHTLSVPFFPLPPPPPNLRLITVLPPGTAPVSWHMTSRHCTPFLPHDLQALHPFPGA